MSQNKNNRIKFEHLAAHIGLAACSIATLAGLIEMHEARNPKLATPMQPAYANATEHAGHEGMDIRKEKEEIRHASVSYGVTMRSHSVAGRA